MRRIYLALAAVLVATPFYFTSTQEADAWACEARGTSGARGWSTRYSSRAQASRRALNECARRTPRSGRCRITYCDPAQ